ncbi:hypothetical protein Tco_1411707 [Tanacetum coccineum]
MFKVFNRCLTTRTSGHDQTKINILQLFHAVIKQTHVDYAALLWWDFINNVFQKKEAIYYPRFTKLIIVDQHSIKDDVPLVSVYTTGNVSVRGMLISNAFLTAEVRETGDFKEYETVFMKMKKRKQTAEESSSPRRIIKKKKQPTPSILPLGDDIERYAIAEATLLNEDSYASVFADSILNDEGADVDDTGSKIEPGSQKENPKRVSDDDEIEKEKEVEKDMKEKENEEVRKEQNIVEKEVANETNVETEKTDDVVKEKEVAN